MLPAPQLYKEIIRNEGCKISRSSTINKLSTLWCNHHHYWLDPKLVQINNTGHARQVASSVVEAFLSLYILIIKEYLWQVSAISEQTVHVFGSPLEKA